jgi:UDP-glucose 4-epimerase
MSPPYHHPRIAEVIRSKGCVVRILVTGGSGFIGQHVVAHLLERGDDVIIADLEKSPNRDLVVEEVIGDLRDPSVVMEAFGDGVDGVIHLAALTSVIKSIENPYGVYETNVGATQLLLERARQLGVDHFVLASTNAVVGNVGDAVIHEDMPIRPLTPYGATKAAGEMLLSAYAASYAMTTVALRLTNVYGVGMQVKDSIVARMMRYAQTNGTLQVYGDGEQRRDYVFVSDAARAFVSAVGWNEPDVVVIGSAHSVSVNEIYELTCEITGVTFGYERIPAKLGEMPAVIVDTSRAASRGFVPAFSLRDGLAATWDDFRFQ